MNEMFCSFVNGYYIEGNNLNNSYIVIKGIFGPQCFTGKDVVYSSVSLNNCIEYANKN